MRALFLFAAVYLLMWFYPVVSAAAAPRAPQQSSKGSKASAGKTTSKKTSRTRRSRRRARGQTSPTTDRIKEIQSALMREGHYTGEPSGKWDSATVDALKRFQESRELKATGKLDARTLQALGLGSEVAGLAPPRESGAGSSSQ